MSPLMAGAVTLKEKKDGSFVRIRWPVRDTKNSGRIERLAALCPRTQMLIFESCGEMSRK